MDKILITGAKGLLGSDLVPNLLKYKKFEIISHSRQVPCDFNFDLSDKSATKNFLNKIMPDVIINLSGLTNVDLCESSPNEAYINNTKTVENLTDWIFYSRKYLHLRLDLIITVRQNIHGAEHISLPSSHSESHSTSKEIVSYTGEYFPAISVTGGHAK
jgi:dTDP-4-dehydrorhamnose reductase